MAASVTASLSHHLGVALSSLTDKRVVSNVRWTLSGNTLYAASQWAMVVVLARCTNPQTVGTLALALAITAPVMILANMQLRAVIATDVTGRHSLCEYFQTRLITTGGALCALLSCCLLFRSAASTVWVLILIAFSKAAESLSDVIHGYWQRIEHMELVGKSLSIRAFLTLGIFAAAVLATRNLAWGCAAFLTGSIGVFLAYDMPQVKRASSVVGESIPDLANLFSVRPVQGRTVVAIVRRTAPLGIAAMLISLNSAIPRYFIELYCGKRQLGIFTALAYFIIAGNLLTNAAGQSVLPLLARLYSLGTRTRFTQALAGLLAYSVAVAAGSIIVAFFFGRQLLLIYGRAYSEAYPTFLLIMAAASIGYSLSILNFSLNAVGAYSVQFPLFLTVTVILVVLCRIAIPLYGITGAAIALLLSNVIQGVLAAVVLVFRVRRSAAQPCTA
jgi:O-antigen/teichoic acid export membrane protein